MNDDIDDLIAMLRASLEASVTASKAALDGLQASLADASEDDSASQTMLRDAIKSQIGVALAEVERFDSTVSSQIKIARAYADSLPK